MFILNKRTNVVMECNNTDAIRVCQKDDKFVVAESIEGLSAPQKTAAIPKAEKEVVKEDVKKTELPTKEELKEMTLDELRAIATDIGIHDNKNMNKVTLVAMISNR